jgi:hypothetical protein
MARLAMAMVNTSSSTATAASGTPRRVKARRA